MPEMIADAIAALRLESAAYTGFVRIWMKIMAVSYFSGLIIAYWDRRALWIVAMAAVTAALLVLFKITFPDLPRGTIGSIIHLGLWPICLLAIWRPVASRHLVFRFWRYWVTALIAISLVLDIRYLLG